MKKHLALSLLFCLFFASSPCAENELETIKQNYLRSQFPQNEEEQQLLRQLMATPKESRVSDQVVVELMDRYTIEPADVAQLLSLLAPDGSFSDIDYQNQNRSGWLPKLHAERMLVLAKAYRQTGSPYFGSASLLDNIHKNLVYWSDKQLVSPNWWHNKIGIPKTLAGVFILIEDKLSPEDRQRAIKLLSQSEFGMTGQNKVWLAGNVLVRGILENNIALVREARDSIASEIKLGEKEGIKLDNSFQQHGRQQQFGNYGSAYILSMSFWASIFADTSMAFDQSQLDILSQLINEGYGRVLWKGYLDVNGLGRQFFRNSPRHKAFNAGFSAIRLGHIDSTNRNLYKSLLQTNFEKTNSPNTKLGLHHFWMSALTVQRRPQWMASIRMSSPTIIGTEAINGDNLQGYYLADGATYVYVDGNEYENIYPCWDWRKVPGVTCYQTESPLPVLTEAGYYNKNAFVGNVNDGQTGITAMSLDRDGITARKSWILTDNYLFCLGAGIASDSGLVVTTAIDQQVSKGDLYQLRGKEYLPTQGQTFGAKGDTRFHHGNKGYIVLDAEKGLAQVETRTGKWHDVMNMYPPQMSETKEVFSLHLDHGRDPKNATYQYLILPAISQKELAEFDTQSIKVISNTKDLQAVFLPKDKIGFVAAYVPADIRLSKDIHLQSKQAALFLLQQEDRKLKISVCDPTQTLSEINISLNGKAHTIALPQGNYKGTSTHIKFDW